MVPPMSESNAEDVSAAINEHMAAGWMSANGFRITRATRDEVVGEMEILPSHLQTYGIVHGGVHAAIVETLASIAAGINAFSQGRTVVGLENHTSFLRAVRSGKLTGVARPLTRGRRSQAWEVTVSDDSGKIAATGRVRLLVLEPDAELAGQKAGATSKP